MDFYVGKIACTSECSFCDSVNFIIKDEILREICEKSMEII